MAPMLYKGHKFDLRAWGLVTRQSRPDDYLIIA